MAFQLGADMTRPSQTRTIKTEPKRSERAIARFQVLGRDADRELIRSVAKVLSEDGPEADRLRVAVNEGLGGGSSKRGGILAALRRSPMVGADLMLDRPFDPGRKVDL